MSNPDLAPAAQSRSLLLATGLPLAALACFLLLVLSQAMGVAWRFGLYQPAFAALGVATSAGLIAAMVIGLRSGTRRGRLLGLVPAPCLAALVAAACALGAISTLAEGLSR